MGHQRRRTRAGAVVLAITAALGACTPDPGAPPTTTEPPATLPTAPRVALPASLAAGTRFLVDHSVPGTDRWDYYLSDADSADAIDPRNYDPLDLLAMFGRVAPDGRALVTGEERPDLGLDPNAVALCATASSDECRSVSGESSDASFSPDGTKISLFVRDAATDTRWLSLLDTDSLDVLTGVAVSEPAATLRHPWNPDSGAIAVVVPDEPGNRRSPTALAVLDASPGATARVILPGTVTRRALSAVGWSDDGWIAYEWLEAGAPAGINGSLQAMPVDGSEPPQLLRRFGVLGVLTHLPDGSVIGNAPSPASTVPHLLRRGEEPEPLALAVQVVGDHGTVDTSTQVFGYLPPA